MNEHTGSPQGDPNNDRPPSDKHGEQAAHPDDTRPTKQAPYVPTADDPRFHKWIVTEITDDAILNSMRDAAVDGVLTTQMYLDSPYTTWYPSTIARRFGSWRAACDMIHVKTGRMDLGISDDELFENIRQVWIHKGSCPTSADMSKSRVHHSSAGATYTSIFSPGGYTNRFGKWRQAQLRFQEWYLQGHQGERLPNNDGHAKYTSTKARRLTAKEKLAILKRDNWTCQWPGCGLSQLTEPNIQLHIDHRIPASRDGSNDPSNLQVLCATHNCGKGKRLIDPEAAA